MVPPKTTARSDHRYGNPGRIRSLLYGMGRQILGAIHDHNKWIDSPRARILESTFEVSGRLFTYGVYLLLAYLAFISWVDIRSGLRTGAFGIIQGPGDPQLALFLVFAASLLTPIVAIAAWISVGLLYNLSVAAAFRVLPRFLRTWVHPAILLALAVVWSAQQWLFASAAVHSFRYAEATVDKALKRQVLPAELAADAASRVQQQEGEDAMVEGGGGEVTKLLAQYRCALGQVRTADCEGADSTEPSP